ncbi:MAG: anhydro-N-acetylmuramic acid kinase [Bacteroidales bacterium]
MKEYTAVGVMSGTSCDGLDLALCHFRLQPAGWKFSIERCRTVPYPETWMKKLAEAHLLNAYELIRLDHEYGHFIGMQVKQFIKSYPQKIDVVASHGHTIFHQPERNLTYQIGHGAQIAAVSGITTVSDFRSLNVAIGGQGAPLVPIGDEILFPDYHACLNLGGFSNISYSYRKRRIAYDICPVNFLFNHYARKSGRLYDENGAMARAGTVHEELLMKLNELDYYKKIPPKSLGREWVETTVLPLIDSYNLSIPDVLRTLNEHAAVQISKAFGSQGRKKILVTGGGALNTFLLERIRKLTHHELFVPDNEILNFKEALIFAFLGVLRIRHQVNCFSSMCGGRFDCAGGAVYEIV